MIGNGPLDKLRITPAPSVDQGGASPADASVRATAPAATVDVLEPARAVPPSTPATALPPPRRGALSTVAHATKQELMRAAWKLLEYAPTLAIELPELGPVAGKLAIDPKLEQATAMADFPDAVSYGLAESAKGNDVYMVTLTGKLDVEAARGAMGVASQSGKLLGAVDVRITVPVSVPVSEKLTASALAGFIKKAARQAAADFPATLARAQKLPGPWELTITGRYGVEGTDGRAHASGRAVREVVVRMRKDGGNKEVATEVARQLVPAVGVTAGPALEPGSGILAGPASDPAFGVIPYPEPAIGILRPEPGAPAPTLDVIDGPVPKPRAGAGLTLGQSVSFYKIERDRYVIPLEEPSDGASKVYGELARLRVPGELGGVQHQELDRAKGWSHTTSGRITLGVGASALVAEAQRTVLAAHDPLIKNDDFRAEASARNVGYERVMLNLSPRGGGHGTTSLGPVMIGGSSVITEGRLEEMVVEHPRSIVAAPAAALAGLLAPPATSDEHLARAPGEQFRTLILERKSLAASVSHGIAKGLGAMRSGVSVTTEEGGARQYVRDVRRYVLPNGRVYVDARSYDLRELHLETKLEAVSSVFSQASAPAILGKYLDGQAGGSSLDLGLVASYLSTLNEQRGQRLLRVELDLRDPFDRQIFELVQVGDLETAAKRAAERPAPFAADPSTPPKAEPGGLVVTYEANTQAVPGYPRKQKVALRAAGRELELLSSASFQGHTTEQARYAHEGGTAVTLQRDRAEQRGERTILWANERSQFQLVRFTERDSSVESDAPQPVTYAVVEYGSREWVGEGDVRELRRFVDAIGGKRVRDETRDSSWIQRLLTLDARRHGSGEINIRCWVPLEGLAQVGRASADQIYTAAAIVAATMDGEPKRKLPAWTGSAALRELLVRWLDARERSRVSSGDEGVEPEIRELDRAYARIAGRGLLADNHGRDLESFRVALDLERLAPKLASAATSDDATLSPAAEAWRELGEKHGRDYWRLAIPRWAILLARDPAAAERRSGDDDLFYIDRIDLHSAADVKAEVEKALPNDDERLQAAKDRARQGKRIVSL